MAEEAYRWSLAHPSAASSRYETRRSSATFYQDLLNPDALPAYRGLLDESPVADLVGDLWQSSDVWFMYEQVFLKEGGEARRTPWHQDSSYLPIAGEKIAVVWITFEPVARENALELVRGSHRGRLYDGSRFDPDDDTAPLYGDGTLLRLPDIEAERDRWDVVSWAVEPGDVVVFHPAMLHGGAPTRGELRRRTLSLRFFGDDAVYSPLPYGGVAGGLPKTRAGGLPETRAGAPETRGDERGPAAFLSLRGRLRPGDPFRHPAFPKVRPRGGEVARAV